MSCPACGAQNPPDAQFCASCGLPLAVPVERGLAAEVRYPDGAFPPRSLGDLLAETFRIYARRFWTLSLIALVSQIPSFLAQLVPIIPLSLALSILGIFLLTLAGGAIVSSVPRHYLGMGFTVGVCYARAWGRFLSLLAGLLIFIGPLVLLVVALGLVGAVVPGLAFMFTIIGVPAVIYYLVSRVLYLQALMIEGKSPMAAMARSRALVAGTWWRVFGIAIVYVLIVVVASIPGFVISVFSPVTGAVLLLIIGTVTTPITYIGATLVYVDLRVRKEGYSEGLMASETAM